MQESRQTSVASGQSWVLNDVSGRPSPASFPALKVGQEIQALVIEQLADGRFILGLAGALVEANDPGGLKAAQGTDSELAVIVLAFDAATKGNAATEMVKYYLQLHYGIEKDYRRLDLLNRVIN